MLLVIGVYGVFVLSVLLLTIVVHGGLCYCFLLLIFGVCEVFVLLVLLLIIVVHGGLCCSFLVYRRCRICFFYQCCCSPFCGWEFLFLLLAIGVYRVFVLLVLLLTIVLAVAMDETKKGFLLYFMYVNI